MYPYNTPVSGEPQILLGHPALRRRSVAERAATVTLGDVYPAFPGNPALITMVHTA
jgi:hypothetical protein